MAANNTRLSRAYWQPGQSLLQLRVLKAIQLSCVGLCFMGRRLCETVGSQESCPARVIF